MTSKPLLIIGWALLSTTVGAAPTKLAHQTAEQTKAKCSDMHGTYFDQDDTYGCILPRGTVRCTEGEDVCLGYPRQERTRRTARAERPKPRPRQRLIQQHPTYPQYQQPTWPFYWPYR